MAKTRKAFQVELNFKLQFANFTRIRVVESYSSSLRTMKIYKTGFAKIEKKT